MKSGCKVAEFKNRSANHLAPAIAIGLVIAWRIHLMTLFSRSLPEVSPDILCSELEIKALKAFVTGQRFTNPDTMAVAVLTATRIDGHIHRS